MNNQSWNEGLFEILCRSPGMGREHWKGLEGKPSHIPDRRDRWRRRNFLPKEFMEEDSGSFSLGSREHHQGTLRCGLYVPPAITTSAPESSLLGMGNSRELFSWSGVCETQRQEHIRTVHYTEPWSIRVMIPNEITSGKALPPLRKEKGKKKRAEPQTQEFLTGLPWKLQRRPKILNKVKQNIHWAHHQISDNTKLCPVTITEWWRPFKHGAKYFGEMNSQSQSSFSSSVYTQRYTVTLKVRGPLTLSVNPVSTLQQAEQWKPQFMGDKQCEWLRFSSSRLKPSRLVDLPTPHFFFPISNAKFRLLQLIFLVLNEALN